MLRRREWCVALIVVLAGCGGGGGGGGNPDPTGTVVVQVDWPTRSPESVPTYANSIVARITANSQQYNLTINRSGDAGYTGSAPFTQGIPIGTHPMTVSAYTNTNGTGSAVATAAINVTVNEGQTTTENVSANLASTVSQVVIDGPFTAVPGVPTQLSGRALNSTGQTLMLPASALVWNLVSGPANLTTAGVLTGTADGTAVVRLREIESGQEATANVQISTPVVTYTIAFVTDRNAPNKYDWFQICTIKSNGADFATVTGEGNVDHDPCFNHNGSKVVFASNRDADFSTLFTEEIYTVTVPGGQVTRVTTNTVDDGFPSYNKTGTQIVFTRFHNNNWEIFRMAENGTGQTQLTNEVNEDSEPRWNHDGTRIIFTSFRSGSRQIWSMDSSNGGNLTQLTQNNEGNNFLPAVSPDGTKIAFVSDRNGQEEIYIMNVNGTGQTRLTNHVSVDSMPFFTQDGAKIVFMSTRNDANEELYSMDLDGANIVRVTNHIRTDQRPTVRLN